MNLRDSFRERSARFVDEQNESPSRDGFFVSEININADQIRVSAEPVRASSFYEGGFSGSVVGQAPMEMSESCESCRTEEKIELYTYMGTHGYVVKTLCEDCWVISHGRGEHV